MIGDDTSKDISNLPQVTNVYFRDASFYAHLENDLIN